MADVTSAATRSWWLRRYQWSWLRPDLIAGLTTAAVVIPQAMAYAAIAGLPVEVGLYAASVPMAAYALAGTSRPLSLSVTSSIGAVTGAAIIGAPDPRQAAATSRRPLDVVETVPPPGAAQISIPPEMLLVRPRSDLFFANVQHFRRDLYAALEARDPKPSIVLIDASRRYLFQFTGHEAVRDIVADLRDQGLQVWGVLPRGEAGDAIRRFRQVFGWGEAQLFSTVSDAIEAHFDQLSDLPE